MIDWLKSFVVDDDYDSDDDDGYKQIGVSGVTNSRAFPSGANFNNTDE